MRLNRSILLATITAAATTGTALAQTDTENPPSTPPDTQVQTVPEATPPPITPPPAAEAPPMAAPAPPAPYAAPYPPPYPGHTVDVVPVSPHMRWMPTSGVGVALFAGGGVTDFTESGARSQTSTGGSWTGRITIGTRSIVGFEGSYIGGANTISGLGNGNATLMRNGVEGALRINLPLYAQDTLLEPYIMGGLGWNGYHVTNYSSSYTASVSTGTDNTLSVPLGVGFTVGYRGFLADLRYTIRPTYDQSILETQANTALTNWDLGGMLGYEF